MVKKTFVLQLEKNKKSFDDDDILFFEKTWHKTRVCTKTGDYYYYGRFSQLMKIIDTAYFIRCHRCYIVNIDQIKSYQNKTIYLSEKIELPVSRHYIKDVKKVLGKKLFTE